MTIQPGQVHHQRYKFERLIGQGAFGLTWQGTHLLLERPVAIKVIDATRLDEASQARAIRECQIGGRLQNAHIVNVFDAYREGADLCIVMEFMAGGSLKEYLSKRRPSLAAGLKWSLDLAEALMAVHAVGIIHRDVKPANILLSDDGQVKIADFGIAHLPGSHLTGEFQPGTPAYRSPEQEENQPVEAAADVYALSAVLFELFAGEKYYPLRGMTLGDRQGQIRGRLAEQQPGAPPPALAMLAEGLAGGLAHQPAGRVTLPALKQALAGALAHLTESSLHAPGQPYTGGDSQAPELSAGAPAELTPLSRIGRYELQALIGRGGMGAVHKAHDPQIGRLVALKTITIVDPSWRARFQQEVRIAGQLNHPHIVTVYDVGEVGSTAYIVMELIEGQTLADLLPSRLPWPEAIKLLLPIGQALDYAHQRGVIHRDVKPANILLAADGRVKLTDFGIARLETASHLTQTGAVMGTPLYMAPEQLESQPVDARADIFALGVILFELVSGQNPFAGDENSPKQPFFLRLNAPDFSALAEVAPPALREIIQKAMAEKPAGRYASAGKLTEALTQALAEASLPGGPAPRTLTLSAPGGLPQVEISGGVPLTAEERNLVATAFSGYDRIYLEGEMTGQDEPARLLIARPVRGGRSLTRVIIKLASPEQLSREWKAYQEYVAGILPQVTAHIQGAPLLSAERKLALLRYTFTGDVGERQADTLLAYYQTKPGSAITALLERNIFQVIAPTWWLNRQTARFPLRREYEALLPPQLVVEQVTETSSAATVLKAGSVTGQDVRRLEPGRPVHLQGFRVKRVDPGRQELLLEASPPARSSERLHLRLTGLTPAELHVQPGDLAPNFSGVITATRQMLLEQAVRAAFPKADLGQPVIELNQRPFPNPLIDYERLLERPVSGMQSIIHGHLTLNTILVEPESGLAWLIDFTHTRQGHNLYDFIRLEVEIIRRILPALVREVGVSLDAQVIGLLQALHSPAPPPQAAHPVLQKPYDLLKTIRRLAGQCMLDPENWDEYYLGLIVMLLGALPELEGEPATARLVLAWAAVSGSLLDQPLYPPASATTAPVPAARASRAHLWLFGGLLAGALGLAAFVSASLLAPAPTPAATPQPPPTATALPPPTFTPTATAVDTTSPTPMPGEIDGILAWDLNVYSGPGKDYEYLKSLAQGTQVRVTGRNSVGNWWCISAGDTSGWVEADFVQVAGAPNLPTKIPSPPPTITLTPLPTGTPTTTNTPQPPPTSSPRPTATPTQAGSPTPGPNVARQLVNDTNGYYALDHQAMAHLDPTSAAFAPYGGELAATEGIKLYTIRTDATEAHIWAEEDESIRPVESIVWSPNGQMIAFVADRKRDCNPCRRVGVLSRAAGQVFYLEPPTGKEMGFPRWTQDGRLLVTIYLGEPGGGTTYVFDTSGRGQIASGSYVLSSSAEGQKWWPWLPGKSWQVGRGGANSYYFD